MLYLPVDGKVPEHLRLGPIIPQTISKFLIIVLIYSLQTSRSDAEALLLEAEGEIVCASKVGWWECA